MSPATASPSLASDRAPARPGTRRGTTLTVDVSDITNTLSLPAYSLNSAASVASVARSLASEMQLQLDVPWALRDERTGAYLDDAKPVGEQLPETGAKVSLVPKAHLGHT